VASESSVDLDPVLAAGLSRPERLAARVHVLRARADSLRGPRQGERALRLALRATEAEQELLADVGIERGAVVLRVMHDHPATVAAVERWQYAQALAWRLIQDETQHDTDIPPNF
jgi:hypothetical protein